LPTLIINLSIHIVTLLRIIRKKYEIFIFISVYTYTMNLKIGE